MIQKLRAQRPTSGSPSDQVGQMSKKSFDQFYLTLTFDDVLEDGDYISTCTVAAETQSDGTDMTATLLDGTTADTVAGTATGGSSTTLTDTAKNFSTLGVQPGDKVLITGTNKAAVTTIKRVKTTTNIFDTIEFEALSFTVTSAEAYKFLFARAEIKAGTAGLDYYVTWSMTSNQGRKFEESALVHILE